MSFISNLFSKKSHSGQSFGYQTFGFGQAFSFGRKDAEQIIEDSYLSNSDVYSIVRRLASVGSNIPLKLYNLKGEKEVEVLKSPLLDLINKPNENQGSKEFMESALTYLFVTGNVYLRKVESSGFGVKQLHIMPSSLVQIQVDSSGQVSGYAFLKNGRTIIVPEKEVIHIKYIDISAFGFESHYGLSPLQAGGLTLEASNSLHKAEGQIFKNKGASGLLTTKGDNTLLPKQAKKIQEAVQEKIAGEKNFGKIPVTGIDMGYIQLGMSPTDLKLIESDITKLRALCNLYSVDSSLFNDPANKTYSNRADAVKDMYANSILPAINKILTPINRDLIENDETVLKPDLSNVIALQKDLKLESERLQKLVQSNIMLISEARESLGLDPNITVNNNPKENEFKK